MNIMASSFPFCGRFVKNDMKSSRKTASRQIEAARIVFSLLEGLSDIVQVFQNKST